MHRVNAGTTVLLTILIVLPLMTTLSAVQGATEDGAEAPGGAAALGISALECKCTYTLNRASDERFWIFQAEPLITGVRRGGPADGRLRSGDVIVGIDGMLIMTRQAGVRFANVRAGEPVEITIRRGGRTIAETIVAEEAPPDALPKIPGLPPSDAVVLGSLSKSIESLAWLLSRSPGEGGPAEVPDPLGLLEGAGLPEDGIPPIGWLGFGLSFSGSIVHQPSNGGPARWHFDSPPKVVSVEADSPADRAGLKRGDVLTHIDGLRLDGRMGEKRFSAIEPGQAVTWTVRRHGGERTIVMIAEERP